MKILYIAAFTVVLCGGAAAQTKPPGVADQTIRQLQALEREQEQRTPAQAKLSSNLLDAIAEAEKRPRAPELHTLRPAAEAQTTGNGMALVILKGEITPQLQAFIISEGGSDIVALPADQVLSARLPLSKIEAVAARPEVKSIDFAQPPVTEDPGVQDPEGDFAHAAEAARTTYSTTGSGQKICIISDSVDYLQEAKDNESLEEVEVLHGDGTGKGEGTAMLEIVHRIAPGAELAFAPGGPTEANMAANVTALQNDDCTIIVDDITYFDESPFQDGLIAQKVRNASDAGILYFSSAANAGNKMHNASGTWEGDFKPSTETFSIGSKTYTFHEFAPDEVYDTMTGPGTKVRTVSLFWDDPLGSATNDYQLAIVDDDNNVVRHSNTTINGTTDPYQYLGNVHPGDRIAILAGPNAKPRFLHLATNRGRLAISTDGTTSGHHASGAENVFTVGQVDARNYQTAPGFIAGTDVHVTNSSADGPRHIFYDRHGNKITDDLTANGGLVLSKPDIAAAACITTDVPGPTDDPDAFHPFCGTSAAAPQAAAIAALLMSARPTLTPAEIKAALMSSALDIETEGWDNVSGAGIVMPEAALLAPAFDTFSFNRPSVSASDIVAGPDGALWFTEATANKIGRIPSSATPGNAGIKEFAIPTADSNALSIAAGPDSALWFTETRRNKIGRITTAGSVSEYPVTTPNSFPTRIAAGPDGALWFTEMYANKIGRITTAGAITEYQVAHEDGDGLTAIAAGPDRAMWFTQYNAKSGFGKIARIPVTATVANPGVTKFPTLTRYDVPQSIAAGPDGAMWFTETYGHMFGSAFVRDKIARIPVTATVEDSGITEFEIPTIRMESPNTHTITKGGGAALWFTDANKIGRITTAGDIEEYVVDQRSWTFSAGITSDSTGTLWLTQTSGPLSISAIARAKPQ